MFFSLRVLIGLLRDLSYGRQKNLNSFPPGDHPREPRGICQDWQMFVTRGCGKNITFGHGQYRGFVLRGHALIANILK